MNTSLPSYRIRSIDILRGIVMIIMALDHTRDYFHVTGVRGNPLDPATTTLPLYFTRWITHFCAPTFVFLSGISAYLSSQKKTAAQSRAFLVKRGFWLIIVEIVIVTFGISFNPFYNLIILQVIWAIGWSMIILGLMSALPYKVILITGLVLFFGHDLAHFYNPAQAAFSVLWKVFLTAFGFIIPLDQSHVLGDFYAILPWTGVMLLGYSIGKWFIKDFSAIKRKQLLLTTGFSAIALFVIVRFINIYGDPSPWKHYDTALKSFLSFLNTSKYPPSLLYCCMTLGPALLLLAWLENINSKWTNIASVYGKVPFFYYVLHFYLLHIVLAAAFFFTGHSSSEITSREAFFAFYLGNSTFSLAGVYVVWISVVASLYFPCRWFGRYRASHRQWWLSYV